MAQWWGTSEPALQRERSSGSLHVTGAQIAQALTQILTAVGGLGGRRGGAGPVWPGLVEWDLLGDWDLEGWGHCQADAWA